MQRMKLSSKRKSDDMIDLLLYPLNRITDYKEFLEKLENWSDQSKKLSHELISKAARRIKRVSQYIEKYKHGIVNRSEMNKVQLFLNKQCNIFAPERRILRRGLMIRRTLGWTSRNKQYIFFLFNDVFLWTTKNGELQNVVMLRDCQVMSSDAKTNPKRKLKVVTTGRKNKILLLECKSDRQRNDWFSAIQEGIILAKAEKVKMDAEKQQGEETDDKDDVPPIMLKRFNRSIDISNTASRRVSGEFRLGDCDSPVLGSPSDETYDNVFEYSRNFLNQELKDIEPLDDMSVSEYDHHLYAFDDEKRESNNVLSPFWKKPSTDSSHNERKIRRVKTMEEQSGLKLITEEIEKDTEEEEDNEVDGETMSDLSPADKHQTSSVQSSPKLNIIRGKPSAGAKSLPDCTTRLEHVSNITIRLNDLNE